MRERTLLFGGATVCVHNCLIVEKVDENHVLQRGGDDIKEG